MATMTLEEIRVLCRAYLDDYNKNGLDRTKTAEICKIVKAYVDSGGEMPPEPPKSDIPPWIVS